MKDNRKKELQEAYKNSKSKMGVYQIKNNITGKCYIGVTQDLKGTMNGNGFKLETGMFKDRELQAEWTENGKEQYEISILAELDYDRDEAKSDYAEDLLVLRDLTANEVQNKKYL